MMAEPEPIHVEDPSDDGNTIILGTGFPEDGELTVLTTPAYTPPGARFSTADQEEVWLGERQLRELHEWLGQQIKEMTMKEES